MEIFIKIIIVLIIIVLVILIAYYNCLHGVPRFPEFPVSYIEDQKKLCGWNTMIDRITHQIVYPHTNTFVPSDAIVEQFQDLKHGIEEDYQMLVNYFEPQCEARLKYFEKNKRKLVERCVRRFYKVYPELLSLLIEEHFTKNNPDKSVWQFYVELRDQHNIFVIDKTNSPECLVACSALSIPYVGYENAKMRRFFPNTVVTKQIAYIVT